MKQIEHSYVIEGSEAEILEHLSPQQVAEYMGYSVRDKTQKEGDDLLRVWKYDTVFTLRFSELAAGYEFTQYGTDGPYRQLAGVVLVDRAPDVDGSDASRVSVDISYTIGTVFSFILNRLAKGLVETDAQQLLNNLARDVADARNSDDDAAATDETTQGEHDRGTAREGEREETTAENEDRKHV